jgi:type II secretory pathway pseudopilin PulG
MKTSRPDHKILVRSRPCFTLVELITVVAIIAMLAAMAIPRFGDSVARQRADAAARRIAADLELARKHAIHASVSQTVTFYPDSSSYVLPGVQHLDHPDGAYKVDLTAEPYAATLVSADFAGSAKVTFGMYGKPDSGGTVRIGVGEHYRTVTLDAESGRTSISE